MEYKDNVHLCLVGLDWNTELDEDSETGDKEETKHQSATDIKSKLQSNTKLSIREFHEYVLQFLIADFVKKGFKYVSYLPGGF